MRLNLRRHKLGLWISTAARNGGASAFSPLSLFASGEEGAWYDPSDFSTMFQDSAGTTPVTAVGQPVGRINDKSGNANNAIQSTAANRPILQGTPTGPNISTGPAALGTGWADSGGGSITGTATTGSGYYGPSVEIGKTYQVTYTVALTSGTVRLNLGSTGGTERTTSGTYEERITAASTVSARFIGVSAFTGVISNVVIKDASPGFLGAPYYLDFDGVNDSLRSTNIDLTATDALTVFAGARKNSDAGTYVLAELSDSLVANSGAFSIFAPVSAGATYSLASKGTSQGVATTSASYSASITNVLTGVCDISAVTCALRVDGVAAASTPATQGTGNYGNHPLNIGSRGGSSLRFPGRVYAFILRGAATPDLSETEAWVAGKTGVTLP